MELADHRRRVPLALEHVGQRHLAGVQRLAVAHDAVYLGIASGEERRPRWRADWRRRVRVRKPHALPGELVEVRRLREVVPRDAEAVVAILVGDQEQDIRVPLIGDGGLPRDVGREQSQGHDCSAHATYLPGGDLRAFEPIASVVTRRPAPRKRLPAKCARRFHSSRREVALSIRPRLGVEWAREAGNIRWLHCERPIRLPAATAEGTLVDRRRFLFSSVIMALGACLAGAADPARPNIVVIVADDYGYGDCGVHGCRDIPTPHIDSIAKGGIRCTSGYVSAPQCAPTRAG